MFSLPSLPPPLPLPSSCCRVAGLVFVLLIQMWVGWTFFSSQWERRRREEKPEKGEEGSKKAPKKNSGKGAKQGKPKTS